RRMEHLKPGEACIGITETIELNPHAIHDREIKAARLPVLVTGVDIVEGTAGFKRSAHAASKHHRYPPAIVLSTDPQVGEEHQAGIVEHGAIAFRHRVEF